MKVRYTETALSEVGEILSYIAENNPAAAAQVVLAIEATVARIGVFPNSAQAADEPGVRMAPVGRFPYLVFYTVAVDEVEILHVRHGARLRPWEKDR